MGLVSPESGCGLKFIVCALHALLQLEPPPPPHRNPGSAADICSCTKLAIMLLFLNAHVQTWS